MTVEMTPISGASASGAYLTVAAARTLGATLDSLSEITALLAETDDSLAGLLLAASLEIDAAMPYQGMQYDADQERQFPRYAHRFDYGPTLTPSETGLRGCRVWDWDSDSNQAVVPDNVKYACLHQAAALVSDPALRRRLDAIRSGLASQSVGSLSESYINPKDLPGGVSGLCGRADQLMQRYRLRTGAIV